jgi:hypothetical protein
MPRSHVEDDGPVPRLVGFLIAENDILRFWPVGGILLSGKANEGSRRYQAD